MICILKYTAKDCHILSIRKHTQSRELEELDVWEENYRHERKHPNGAFKKQSHLTGGEWEEDDVVKGGGVKAQKQRDERCAKGTTQSPEFKPR